MRKIRQILTKIVKKSQFLHFLVKKRVKIVKFCKIFTLDRYLSVDLLVNFTVFAQMTHKNMPKIHVYTGFTRKSVLFLHKYIHARARARRWGSRKIDEICPFLWIIGFRKIDCPRFLGAQTALA